MWSKNEFFTSKIPFSGKSSTGKIIHTLFAFSLVCIGVLIMRKKMPDAPRAFKTPFVPFVPIIGVIVCVYLMYSLPNESWARLAVWLGLGLVIYFTYSRKNSKISNKQ